MICLRKSYCLGITLVVICSFWVHTSLASPNNAVNDPVALLRVLSQKILLQLQQHKTDLANNDRQYIYKLVYNVVTPHLQLDEMVKQVLPVNILRTASPQELQDFKTQFVQLIIYTYASSLATYTNQTVTFFPIRGDYNTQKQVTVASVISSQAGDTPLQIQYKLMRMRSADSWKIYDMSVAGISLIESFRSQFAYVTGDLSMLTNKLIAHNAKIKK